MFSLHQRAIVGSLSLVTMLLGAVLPASAQTYQHASNSNLWHVRHHIEFDIRNLQHDARDYHGYRDAAIQSLQHARNEILPASNFPTAVPTAALAAQQTPCRVTAVNGSAIAIFGEFATTLNANITNWQMTRVITAATRARPCKRCNKLAPIL